MKKGNVAVLLLLGLGIFILVAGVNGNYTKLFSFLQFQPLGGQSWQTAPNNPNTNPNLTGWPDKPSVSTLVPQNGQCPPTYHPVTVNGVTTCRQQASSAPGR